MKSSPENPDHAGTVSNPWLAALLNTVPGVGMGYLYVYSPKWWVLGIVLALALAAVAGGVWIAQELNCVDLTGWEQKPPCSDSELAASERNLRNFKNLLVVTFMFLTVFNVWNAWRLAAKRNKKMRESTG